MATSRERWLFGPLPDLLFGCGGAYVLVLLWLSFAGPGVVRGFPVFVMPLLLTLLVSPHFGATLLRVYESRESRREYFRVAVGGTLLLAILFVVGVYDTRLVPWLFTAYLTLSPWHYSAQNFGLAMMFLRRRGVPVDRATRRCWSASFLCSFALVFLVLHEGSGSPTLIDGLMESVPFRPLGLPHGVVSLGVLVFGAGSITAMLLAVRSAARGGRARDLGPALVLALSQLLWFTLPLTLRHLRSGAGTEVLAWQHRGTTFLFIALAHSVQYLWVSAYFARRQGSWSGSRRYLLKTLVAGVALTTWPVLVFAPGFLGGASYGAAILWLMPAVVNLHHYMLDGVIWKLRRPGVARVLVNPDDSAAQDAAPAPRTVRPRRVVWAVAAIGVMAQGFVFWNAFVVYPTAFERRDEAGQRRALQNLTLLGYDPAPQPRQTGVQRSAALAPER